MSRTYSIGCVTCQKHLWIGQSSGVQSIVHIYGGDKIDLLTEFLIEHKRHELIFGENCESVISEMNEIDT